MTAENSDLSNICRTEKAPKGGKPIIGAAQANPVLVNFRNIAIGSRKQDRQERKKGSGGSSRFRKAKWDGVKGILIGSLEEASEERKTERAITGGKKSDQRK